MPDKMRSYEQFGPYVLFKKLESDALGDPWRAARIDDRHLGPLVALRRLTGGDREALLRNVADARAIAPLLDGTSFVKGQIIDVIDGVPFVAHEYGGGRSLRHIVDRARGGSGITPNPIPIDQAILIAEKVALSLETVGELRYGSNRLTHGALLPQFVWITDDGEIRVAGQQLGKGLIASLKDAKIRSAIGRYFSPEYQHSAEPSKASEVFSLGGIFFLLVTGHEPPEAAAVSAFGQTVRAARTIGGQPLPDDIRAILDKSLTIDPERRYESVAAMKQALASLANSGKYSATTFNLAFYLSTLLKKEMEGEALERDKESKTNVVPYLEAIVAKPLPALPAPATKSSGKKSILPIAAAVAIAVTGTGAWFVMKGSTSKTKAQIASSQKAPPPAIPPIVPQPAAAGAAVPEPQTATIDPAAQKKAFEAAVNQKLQEEMGKLQSQFNKDLQQQKPRSAPAQSPPVLIASVAPQRPAQVADDRTPSAAALDERRLAARQETAAGSPTQTLPLQPQPAAVQAQISTPVSAPVQSPAVREGDVVDFDQLDVRPQPVSAWNLIYPPMAMRQGIEAALILTVFVSETGKVLDVKVLRGDPRFGFEDEAIRVLRGMRFTPGIKDGKRVRTWMPQPIRFKLK